VVAEVAKDDKTLAGARLSDADQADDIVRLTVMAATFVRAASAPAAVEAAMLAFMPVESRTVAARVLPAAVKGDYGPLMDMVGNEERMVLPLTFAPAAIQESLLAQMDIRRSADESRFVSVGIERQWGKRRPLPVLPLPLPGGYQNQGIREWLGREDGLVDRVSDRIADRIAEGGGLLDRLTPGGCGRPIIGCGLPIIGCGLPIIGCGHSNIISPCDCGVLP